MKVVFDPAFHAVYSSDPASAEGRMEAVLAALPKETEFIPPSPATREQLAAAHTLDHIDAVKQEGVYEIAALAAGGAITSARTGISEPCFGLIRPPGHHASAGSAWGFCYFNNMAVALLFLKEQRLIETALVLDIDLHYGDGTVNILGKKSWVTIFNPEDKNREGYLAGVRRVLEETSADIIGISAGFDNHVKDWGGLLETRDYFTIGQMAAKAAAKNRGGCFAILEGGYNHHVLGQNVAALISGLSG